MAAVEFKLEHGLTVGKGTLVDVVMREATAGDVIEAQEEAEKLVMVPLPTGGVEPMLLPSPTKVSTEVLRRQIVKLGNISGPISLAELKQLHPTDLNRLHEEADKLEAAAEAELTSQAVTQRGRSDSPGKGAG